MNNFSISLLSKEHIRADFCCGIDELDDYLKKRASQDTRKRVAVTYVLVDNEKNKVAGYYTLSSSAIELVSLPENIIKKLPRYSNIPATLIGRLAIDGSYKGQGLGAVILFDAMEKAYKASLCIASYAVLVEAINKNAEAFYKKHGFINLLSKNKLYIPMSTIDSLLGD